MAAINLRMNEQQRVICLVPAPGSCVLLYIICVSKAEVLRRADETNGEFYIIYVIVN